MENNTENSKIIHPNVKDSRVLTYLNLRNNPEYENTAEEDQLVEYWEEKLEQARAEYEKSRANSKNVNLWRKAFEGDFCQLDEDGNQTDKKMKAVRKLAFELVEERVNSHIPAPKMTPRYHSDLVPVNTTENLIRHTIDKMLSEQTVDESEHHVLIDATVWFKVGWNPFDNTHERSGNPIVTVCPVDTVFPQPGVKNYKDLEYIFEESSITVAKCLDYYGREIHSPEANDIIPITTVYYLNEDRYVGKFCWCHETGKVLCNDVEWGIRKRRECKACTTVVPIDNVCPNCGGKKFHYVPVKEEIVTENLVSITNPYRSGESQDSNDDKTIIDDGSGIPAGTILPHYLIRQLPFVPYRKVSVPGSIYGISEVETVLEDQDLINKLLNKAEKKSAQSKTYVTKLRDTNIEKRGEEITEIEVDSPQEGQAIQVKQVMADISQEITEAQILYEVAKSTVGVTDTDQGKNDPSARSGKAKQLQMQASAQRTYAPDRLRNMAYAGVYELIFKNLLAYCDEERSFVSLLPDGTEKEEVWSKYMFLNKDDHGEYYYRDDYAWSVDTATEITEDRAAMWQLIDNDYLNGVMGNQIDPTRALLMYWQMKDQCGYPLAKYAIGFIKDAQQHLPSDVERTLVENPEAVQLALSFLKDKQMMAGLQQSGQGQGGARLNAGREGNGATHAANVEKTNNKNRAQSGAAQTNMTAATTGGAQGGMGKEAIK